MLNMRHLTHLEKCREVRIRWRRRRWIELFDSLSLSPIDSHGKFWQIFIVRLTLSGAERNLMPLNKLPNFQPPFNFQHPNFISFAVICEWVNVCDNLPFHSFLTICLWRVVTDLKYNIATDKFTHSHSNAEICYLTRFFAIWNPSHTHALK